MLKQLSLHLQGTYIRTLLLTTGSEYIQSWARDNTAATMWPCYYRPTNCWLLHHGYILVVASPFRHHFSYFCLSLKLYYILSRVRNRKAKELSRAQLSIPVPDKDISHEGCKWVVHQIPRLTKEKFVIKSNDNYFFMSLLLALEKGKVATTVLFVHSLAYACGL